MRTDTITVRSSNPPVVEIDTESQSAYVRFSDRPVARTEVQQTSGPIITMDFDDAKKLIGVELIGVQEFSIKQLLVQVRISVKPALFERARYIAARKRDAMAAA